MFFHLINRYISVIWSLLTLLLVLFVLCITVCYVHDCLGL